MSKNEYETVNLTPTEIFIKPDLSFIKEEVSDEQVNVEFNIKQKCLICSDINITKNNFEGVFRFFKEFLGQEVSVSITFVVN